MPRTKLDNRADPFYAKKTRRVANEIIRAYMGKADMSLAELGRAIMKPASTVSARLNDNGDSRPWELPELVAICSVLKISADDRAKMLGG